VVQSSAFGVAVVAVLAVALSVVFQFFRALLKHVVCFLERCFNA